MNKAIGFRLLDAENCHIGSDRTLTPVALDIVYDVAKRAWLKQKHQTSQQTLNPIADY